MKQEDAEKLVCPQLSGPVCDVNGDTWLERRNCETTHCVLWNEWGMIGDEHGHFAMEGDCGLRTLGELNVSCNGGV